ncbi:MAG: glycosyltransferase [Planctomycetota bacterium]
MKLAYLVDRFPVPSETFIARELEGLAARGVPPVVFALRPSDMPDISPATGAVAEIARDVRVLPSPTSLATAAAKVRTMLRSPGRVMGPALGMIRGAFRSPLTAPAELLRANAAFPLARELAREGVTHLHAHFGFVPSTVAWFAAHLAGIQWSVSVHAWDIFVNRSMMPEKLLAARRVVTCTDFARGWLLERYPSIPRGRVVTVHHGLDAAGFKATPIPDGPPRFAAVGRLVAKKGFGVLLRAFARVRAALVESGGRSDDGRDASLTLVGDGPERGRLESIARALALGDSVVMTGALSQTRVREEMTRARTLVVPSVRGRGGDMDGLPNVILEAMASARPVIGSRFSGIPEAVEDGRTGLLVPAGDDQELARAMLALARDRWLAARMGEAGRRVVEERFTTAVSVAKLVEVLRALGAIA